jgi:L-ribulose-5-phosphate 3-epimerase UlaE
MIYNVQKTIASELEDEEPKVTTLEIDDTVYFNDQPEEFKELFRQCKTPEGYAQFDNCTAFVNDLGRVLFN